MVFNTNDNLNTVLNLEVGKHQASKKSNTRNYHSIEGKLIYNKQHILSAKYAKKDFGSYDFERELDVAFPEQSELEYIRLLDKGLSEKKSSKVGIKGLYRKFDESSTPEDPAYQDDDMFEVRAFYEYNF